MVFRTVTIDDKTDRKEDYCDAVLLFFFLEKHFTVLQKPLERSPGETIHKTRTARRRQDIILIFTTYIPIYYVL